MPMLHILYVVLSIIHVLSLQAFHCHLQSKFMDMLQA